jgi:hypothetical protein
MVYILSNDSDWTWYTGWVSGEPWKMDRIIGLTADEIAEFRKRAEPSLLRQRRSITFCCSTGGLPVAQSLDTGEFFA